MKQLTLDEFELKNQNPENHPKLCIITTDDISSTRETLHYYIELDEKEVNLLLPTEISRKFQEIVECGLSKLEIRFSKITSDNDSPKVISSNDLADPLEKII